MPTAQQKWNEKNPEKMREYDRNRRGNYKQVNIRLHKEHDRQLIEYLEANKLAFSDFFKNAAVEKMNNSK